MRWESVLYSQTCALQVAMCGGEGSKVWICIAKDCMCGSVAKRPDWLRREAQTITALRFLMQSAKLRIKVVYWLAACILRAQLA